MELSEQAIWQSQIVGYSTAFPSSSSEQGSRKSSLPSMIITFIHLCSISANILSISSPDPQRHHPTSHIPLLGQMYAIIPDPLPLHPIQLHQRKKTRSSRCPKINPFNTFRIAIFSADAPACSVTVNAKNFAPDINAIHQTLLNAWKISSGERF